MTTRWDPELIPYLDWMARHLPQEMPVAPREVAERARARITGTGTTFGAVSGPVVAHGGARAALEPEPGPRREPLPRGALAGLVLIAAGAVCLLASFCMVFPW